MKGAISDKRGNLRSKGQSQIKGAISDERGNLRGNWQSQIKEQSRTNEQCRIKGAISDERGNRLSVNRDLNNAALRVIKRVTLNWSCSWKSFEARELVGWVEAERKLPYWGSKRKIKE